MVDLALQQDVAFVSLQSIARRQQMSLSHLEHLFARLRRHGLVRASRGPGGGYALARSAVQISIADIVSAVDQSVSPPFGHSIPASNGGLTPEAAIAESLWKQADAHLLAAMRDIDLQCLVDTRVFTARLGERVAGRLGLPITEDKLLSVTVTEIKLLLVGEDTVENMVEPEQDMDSIKRAVRYLWGENSDQGEVHVAEPTLDLPGSLRVAIASNNGESLDGHFGSALCFLVYQVNREAVHLVDVRPTTEADASDDRNAARAALIRDCQLLYIQSIGGLAAAKVVRAGVYPVKVKTPGPAREAIAQLQTILDAPPPWLDRVMGVEARSLARFKQNLKVA